MVNNLPASAVPAQADHSVNNYLVVEAFDDHNNNPIANFMVGEATGLHDMDGPSPRIFLLYPEERDAHSLNSVVRDAAGVLHITRCSFYNLNGKRLEVLHREGRLKVKLAEWAEKLGWPTPSFRLLRKGDGLRLGRVPQVMAP